MNGNRLFPTSFPYTDYLEFLLDSGYTKFPAKSIGLPPYLGEGIYCFDSLKGCWEYAPEDNRSYNEVLKLNCIDNFDLYNLDDSETIENLFLFLKKDFISFLKCKNFEQDVIESYEVLNKSWLAFLYDIIFKGQVNADDEKVVFSVILYLQKALFSDKYKYDVICRTFSGEKYRYYVIVNSDIISKLSYSNSKDSDFRPIYGGN